MAFARRKILFPLRNSYEHVNYERIFAFHTFPSKFVRVIINFSAVVSTVSIMLSGAL